MNLEILEFVSIALLIVGFVGHGIQMRKINQFNISQGTQSSFAVFFHKSNTRWYAVIAASIILWAVALYL